MQMIISNEEIIGIVKSLPIFGSSEISVERLFSGTNIVSLVKNNTCAVIFRQFKAAKLIDTQREREVFSLASQAGIGPKAILISENYRIEEFIEGTTMERTQCSQFLESTARSLANFHSIPMQSNENSIKQYLVNWKIQFEQNLHPLTSDPSISSMLNYVNSEFSSVLDLLVDNTEEFVLCHNDFSYGNLLVTPTGVRIIDYDYSGLGHPSIDLASFCIETMFDFSQPVYQYLPQDELKKDEQENFVRFYAEARNWDFDDLWKKFLHSKAIVCFLGAFWAGCQYSESNQSMLDYLRIRLSLYEKYKSELSFL